MLFYCLILKEYSFIGRITMVQILKEKHVGYYKAGVSNSFQTRARFAVPKFSWAKI